MLRNSNLINMHKEKYHNYSWVDKLPDSTLEVHEENFYEFFRTMFERQEIFYKRFNKQPKPWTEDVILRDNKYTNVYRELDRQSQFLISNIIIPFDNSRQEIDLLYYYIIFYKLFNNNEFFEFLSNKGDYKFSGIPLPEQYNPDEFYAAMNEATTIGLNPYTNAYLTNSKACPGKSRDECFAYKVIPTMISKYKEISEVVKTGDAEDLIKFLETIPSVAGFLSHEFFQDFTYITRYCKNYSFPYDQNDYTNVGPGCEMGIRLIFPNRKTGKEKKQGIYDLRDLSSEALKHLGDFKYLNWDKKRKEYCFTSDGELSLHNIEFWLCEYQKYWKMIIGQGKQRSKINAGEGKDYSFYLY